MELLRRKTSTGMIAGVAAGIAERLEVGAGLVRVAFAVTTLFGGIGFVLYGAAWLLLPSDRSDASIAENWLSGSTERNSWGGAVLIGIAALIVISSIDAVDGSFALAAALGVIGVLMYRGTFDPSKEESVDASAPQMASPARDAATLGADTGATGHGAADTATTEAVPGSSVSASALSDQAILGRVDAGDADSVDRQGADGVGQDGPGAPGLSAGAGPIELSPAPESFPPPLATPTQPSARPAVGSSGRTARRRSGREPSRLGTATFALMLVVLGALALADTTFGVSLTATDYLAAALAVVGLGLLVGTFFGRSRALIVLGLIILMFLQFATWFRVPITGGFGDPRYRPVSLAELEPEYRLAAGDMVVDLSDMADLSEMSDTVSVDISLAAGALRVILPAEVDVNLDVSVVAGDVTTTAEGNQTFNEVGPDIRLTTNEITEAGAPGLDVDIDMGFGELIVVEERAVPGPAAPNPPNDLGSRFEELPTDG